MILMDRIFVVFFWINIKYLFVVFFLFSFFNIYMCTTPKIIIMCVYVSHPRVIPLSLLFCSPQSRWSALKVWVCVWVYECIGILSRSLSFISCSRYRTRMFTITFALSVICDFTLIIFFFLLHYISFISTDGTRLPSFTVCLC